MQELKAIIKFGAPYMKRYWFRLAAGVLLGIVFGLSNASFVWATKTLFERLTPPATTQSVSAQTNVIANVAAAKPSKPKAFAEVRQTISGAIDPWLPMVDRKVDWRQIFGGLLFLPLLVGFRGYIGYLSSYCMNWVSERVIRDLRLDVLIKLNSLSIAFYDRTTMGELLARVNSDAGSLYRCLNLGFSDLVKEPVTVVGIVCALFWVDWQLALLALIFAPLSLVPISIIGRKLKRLGKSGVGVNMMQDSLLVEVFSSIRVVKAYCLEDWQVGRFRQIFKAMGRLGIKSMQAKELLNPIIETLSMFGLGVVIVFIFTTHKTIPELIAFLTGVVMLYTPIKKLGGISNYFSIASIGATRLVELFNEQPTVREKPDAAPLLKFSRELTLENVSFSYDGKKTVLNGVSLRVPRGFKLGVAGESGSGKSTLTSLLMRFYDPVEGSIRMDGRDLRDISFKDLRAQIALMTQDVVVFDQTVAENIACGKLDATRAEIEAAAREAYAHDFITQLPQGYDTRLGERGITLSGGQRQRIAIARAFVRNAPILILDEATASLDSASEAEVQATIEKLAEHRTVICIAHRLSTLRSCDQIVVFSQGRAIEQGGFEELLQRGGVFCEMAARQGMRAERSAELQP